MSDLCQELRGMKWKEGYGGSKIVCVGGGGGGGPRTKRNSGFRIHGIDTLPLRYVCLPGLLR